MTNNEHISNNILEKLHVPFYMLNSPMMKNWHRTKEICLSECNSSFIRINVVLLQAAKHHTSHVMWFYVKVIWEVWRYMCVLPCVFSVKSKSPPIFSSTHEHCKSQPGLFLSHSALVSMELRPAWVSWQWRVKWMIQWCLLCICALTCFGVNFS